MSNEGPVENGDISAANGNVPALFSKESVENSAVKEERSAKRVRRPSKGSPRKEEGSPTDGHFVFNKVESKNSRKSRTGYGRGLPKKGGAGGKGTWGAPGSEIAEDSEAIDSQDPNYDSDSQVGILMRPVQPAMTDAEFHQRIQCILQEYLHHGDTNDVVADVVVKTIKPEMEEKEVQSVIEPLIKEYFESGDTGDLMMTIQELNIGKRAYKLPQMAISLALDRKATHREMTSILISDLYGDVLTQEEVAKGFDDLLESLNDLSLDTPEAPNILGQFIARAVADDCLPPKYVSSYKGKVECPRARTALDKADVLLNMKHGIVRLDNVWGVGGGNRPVKYLIKKMVLLLKEYLSSGDIAEAMRCLTELEVPHFHHELVYEAVVLAIETSTERAMDMIVKLLKKLYDVTVITADQMTQGFKRVYDAMPDICLDVPAAYTLLEQLAEKCHKENVLSNGLYRELPNKGRKRFVSEGDGGRVKENPPIH